MCTCTFKVYDKLHTLYNSYNNTKRLCFISLLPSRSREPLLAGHSLPTLHLSPCPFMLSFGVFCFPTHLMALRSLPLRTHTHTLYCCNLLLPCIHMSLRAASVCTMCIHPFSLFLSLVIWCPPTPYSHTLPSQHLWAFVCVCGLGWVSWCLVGTVNESVLRVLGTGSTPSL